MNQFNSEKPAQKWGQWRSVLAKSKLYQRLDYSIRGRKNMLSRKRGERELKVLRKLIDPKRASIDVGANQGIYTYWLQKYSKKVYAYEPNKAVKETFLGGVGANVEVRQIALSNRTGTSKLFIPVLGAKDPVNRMKPCLAHQGGSLTNKASIVHIENVKTCRLDELEHDPVGFIKIDVEGHEMEVLEGARELIKNDRPVLLIEILQFYHNRPLLDNVSEIEKLGYQANVLYHSEFVHPSRIPPEYFLNEHPHAIENFFFIPDFIKFENNPVGESEKI